MMVPDPQGAIEAQPLQQPTKPEIDQRTIKLIVGVIAISMPLLTRALAHTPIRSISESYYAGGWAQSIFVGFLFAIAAFLMAYNGLDTRVTVLSEMVLSKVAAGAALGVALFPCTCIGEGTKTSCAAFSGQVPYVHGLSAALMFVILAYFCRLFYLRSQQKDYPEARVRGRVYVACGIAILFAIGVDLADRISDHALSHLCPRLEFWCETVGLVAFGVSWLTASRTIPGIGITNPMERFSPLRRVNPTS